MIFRFSDNVLTFADTPILMGILNVTRDSFSDGGRFLNAENAVQRGLELIQQGAAILDVGGESTRPGFTAVAPEEEIARVVPVIRELSRRTKCIISIDTSKAVVAKAALEAGASIVNDVTSLQGPAMAEVIAEAGAGCILMHNARLTPVREASVVEDVIIHLRRSMEVAQNAGIPFEKIMVDPGIGFGLTKTQDVQLMRELKTLECLGRPVLLAMSRKSVLGYLTGQENPELRDAATIGAALASFGRCQVLRVHEPGMIREALAAFAAINGDNEESLLWK